MEEGCVLIEAVCHRKFVRELVVALDRLAVRRFAVDRNFDTGLGDVVEDAPSFPSSITGAQALFAQRPLLVRTDFIVGDADALTPAAVLLVQPHHGVGSRARPSEEVENDCIGLVYDEKSKGVLYSIQRLWEWEFTIRHELEKQPRSILRCIMRTNSPLSSGHGQSLRIFKRRSKDRSILSKSKNLVGT